MLRSIGTSILLLRRVWKRIMMHMLKPLFAQSGKNVHFDPFGHYSYETIYIGSDVFIGDGAKIMGTDSKIFIGDKVMFGPNVTLMAGDHNTGEIGRYMYDVHEKRPQDDQPIIIQDDVWIGSGAIILKGVTLGTGSIVGAGAVVTRSTNPYSIVVGNPAKMLRKRLNDNDILKHECLLHSSLN